MDRVKKVINELLVDVFNQILSIEQQTLRNKGVTLSMTEVHVLEAIRNAKVPNMTSIAKKLRITLGTLTTSVKVLVAKAYVVRYYDDNDRRIVLLKLTDTALEVLKVHDQFHKEMISSIFDDLKIEQNDVLIKSLTSLKEFFREKY